LLERGLPKEAALEVARDLAVRAIYADATALLGAGASPFGVSRKLEEKGIDKETASAVVTNLMMAGGYTVSGSNQMDFTAVVGSQIPSAAAAELLPLSTTRRERLGADFMALLGGLVFILGLALFLGNISGLFRTFPFAGFLVMTLGGAMRGFGRIMR
jgi:hypothetical protein